MVATAVRKTWLFQRCWRSFGRRRCGGSGSDLGPAVVDADDGQGDARGMALGLFGAGGVGYNVCWGQPAAAFDIDWTSFSLFAIGTVDGAQAVGLWLEEQ